MSLEVLLFFVWASVLWLVLIKTFFLYKGEFGFIVKAYSWEDVFCQLIFLIPSVLVIGALLSTGHKIVYGSDWMAYYDYHQVVLDSLKSGHLSHWSTTISGGFPWAGHPDSPSVSIFMIPITIFGVFLGLKVNIVIIYLMYVIATFLFTLKHIKLSLLSSAAVSSLVLVSTLVAVRVATQQYTSIFSFLVPVALFFFFEMFKGESARKRFWSAWSTAIISAMIFYQGHIIGVINVFFLVCVFIAMLIMANKKNRLEYFLRGTAVFFLIALLAAPKILPMLEVLSQDSRFVSSWERLRYHVYTPLSLIYALITSRYEDINWVTANQVIGLGWIPFLMAWVGVFSYPRRTWIWLVVVIIVSLIVLGGNSILPLGYYLWYLPFFHSMEDLDKWLNFYIMFSIAVLCGFGWEKLRSSSSGRVIMYISMAVVLCSLTATSVYLHKNEFTVKPPLYGQERKFFSIQRLEPPAKWGMLSFDYLYHLQNIGVTEAYTNIKLPIAAQPKYFVKPDYSFVLNPNYKGEVYFEQGKGSIDNIRFSQNEVYFKVKTDEPGLLVINQNYSPHWKVSSGEIVNDGSKLLKIRLNRVGAYDLRVCNINRLFMVGCILACFPLILWWPLLNFLGSKL